MWLLFVCTGNPVEFFAFFLWLRHEMKHSSWPSSQEFFFTFTIIDMFKGRSVASEQIFNRIIYIAQIVAYTSPFICATFFSSGSHTSDDDTIDQRFISHNAILTLKFTFIIFYNRMMIKQHGYQRRLPFNSFHISTRRLLLFDRMCVVWQFIAITRYMTSSQFKWKNQKRKHFSFMNSDCALIFAIKLMLVCWK